MQVSSENTIHVTNLHTSLSEEHIVPYCIELIEMKWEQFTTDKLLLKIKVQRNHIDQFPITSKYTSEI